MDSIKDSFQKIQSLATADGAQAELLIHEGESLEISYQGQKLEKYESTTSRQGGFRVLWRGGQGYSFTEDFSAEALVRAYREALSNAKALRAGLKDALDADSPPLAEPVDFQGLDHLDSTEDVSLTAKMELALELERQAFAQDKRVVQVPYAGFQEIRAQSRILNTKGVDAQFGQRYFSGYSYVLARQEAQTKAGGEGFFSRDFAKIQIEPVCRSAAQKALSRLGAKPLPTGRYTVILDKEVIPAFISMLLGHLSAQHVLDEKSLLKDKTGQTIAASILNLIDDPFDERGGSLRPFDSEGTASQRTPIIQDGVLKTYLTNLETSQKLGLDNTGHAHRSPTSQLGIAPSNLVIQSGSSSLNDLLGARDKVVHLTNINGGLHAGYKQTTGDFSLPAEGFLYKGGQCLGPVDQFVVSGNILELLMKIESIGREYNRPGHSILSPDLLISELSFAGA